MLEKIKNFFKSLKDKFSAFVQWAKENPKDFIKLVARVSYVAIIFIISIVGVYFILEVDSTLKASMWQVNKLLKDETASQALVVSKSKSLCLMIAIVLAFGCAAASAFSEIRKDKPILVYLLKALVLVLAICFVVFVHTFDSVYLVEKAIPLISSAKILTLVFGYIGIGTIIINIASNAYVGIEE